MHERARAEIKNRRNTAEYTASQHKNELSFKYPEFHFIETELAKTGHETVRAFSLPKEKAEIELKRIREKNSQLREERKNLLKALNLPEDYLDVNYTCKKCQDTGLIENFDEERRVSYGTKLCDCHNELLKKYASEKMSSMTPLELSSFEDFDLDYYPRQANEIGAISPYDRMKTVYESCKNYAYNFGTDSNSLYFYGRTGLGKTHLSLAIANEVIKKGYNVVYGSVINFLNKLEREKFGRTDSYETEDILIGADLLILDDLGAEFSTAVATSSLYNIINSRIARNVPTIISSNLSIKELQERYPESVASRIIGNYSTVIFEGKDIRQLQNNE
jgi:DNA replication protein DnaC